MQQDTVEGMHDSHQVCGLQQGWQSSRVLVFIVKYVWSAAEEERERMQVHVFLLSVFSLSSLTLHSFDSQFGFILAVDPWTFQTVSSTPFQAIVHIVVILCDARSSQYNLADQTELPDKVLSTWGDLIRACHSTVKVNRLFRSREIPPCWLQIINTFKL